MDTPRPALDRRTALTLLLSAAVAGPLAATHAASAAPRSTAAGSTTASPAATPPLKYVAVSVATVWTDPSSPRPVDAKAIANPADMPGWVAGMSQKQRLQLTGDNLDQTQVLYGRPVYVLSHKPGWTEVAVKDQPSPKNELGYPGWIPDRQLVDATDFARTAEQHPLALVDSGIAAPLYADRARKQRLLDLSAGTRLPVLARVGQAILVDTPDRGAAWVDASTVSVYDSADAIPAPTRADLVRTAKLFLRQPYVWSGRAGWGVDCSGLTGLVYEMHGITIGRDAGPQAFSPGAHRVATKNLAAGDLLFYGKGGEDDIHHVAMYVGNGRMIEAYGAGVPVRVTPTRLDGDYWGAVRFAQVRA